MPLLISFNSTPSVLINVHHRVHRVAMLCAKQRECHVCGALVVDVENSLRHTDAHAPLAILTSSASPRNCSVWRSRQQKKKRFSHTRRQRQTAKRILHNMCHSIYYQSDSSRVYKNTASRAPHNLTNFACERALVHSLIYTQPACRSIATHTQEKHFFFRFEPDLHTAAAAATKNSLSFCASFVRRATEFR